MESKLPALYSKKECPFGMRARLAFLGSKVKCEFLDVEDKQKASAKFEGILPKKSDTWIELSNGQVIDDTGDIMKFALGVSDPDKWLKCDNLDHWLSYIDKLFMNGYKIYLHPDAYVHGVWQKEMEFFLVYIESELYKNNGFLDGSKRWTVKDALALPMLYKLSTMDEEWWNKLPYPKLKTWLNKFKSSKLFQKMTSDKS